MKDGTYFRHFGAFVELLGRDYQPHACLAADPSVLDQPQALDSSNRPDHGCSRAFSRQGSQVTEQVQASRMVPPRSGVHSTQGHVRPARRHSPVVAVTRDIIVREGEIPAAFMNVEHLRRSLHYSPSPNKMMKLAAALSHLSDLLDKADRAQEALKASQESAELYRTLLEGEH
ncbi:hypothetical protein OPQ81_010459 [Rhizoctonia solani]|nr:hypothetical protein OPQ81_010459 [Rhizoctonia solani]